MTNLSVRGSRLGRGTALFAGLLAASWAFSSFDAADGATPPAKKTDTKKTDPKSAKDKDKDVPVRKTEPVAESIVNISQVKTINDQISAAWKENNVKPSELCSDYEFIRRASLDIIGRIARTDEIAKYLADPPQSRRGMLIDRLLASEDYAENWSNIWTTWLMTRTNNKLYQEQMQLWMEEQLTLKKPDDTASTASTSTASTSTASTSTSSTIAKPKQTDWSKIVHDLIAASGENNENGAVNFVLSHLGEPTPAPKISEEGQFSFVPITARTTRLFLATQIQCTQCHDHPFNPQWKQKHFWGVNAFFRQTQRDGNTMMRQQRGMAPPKLALKDNDKLNPANQVYYETRKAVVLSTRSIFLDGKKFDSKLEKPRRSQLAEYVVKHDSFAKAYVNRMWAHFFGRGMTVNGKDFDDFGEHNAETHPELLDFLAKEFRSSGHDPRAMVRWICNSRAYSLSSIANASNIKTEAEPFFGRMLLKAMSPEQLFESLWVSTYANPRAKNKKSKEDQKKLREEWMAKLTSNFGDDEGNEVTFNGTVVQALMLMNGKEINDAINEPDGLVNASITAGMKKGGPVAVLDDLFLSTLNRKPTSEEIRKVREDFKPVLTKEKNLNAPYQDLLWALLNSSEFILNH